ncbi:MAG: hypothetical protein VCC00_15035 [Deltaproteobacteria bacterium]
MTSLLFVAAIVAAIAAMALKKKRTKEQAVKAVETALARPGATIENAIYIRTFTEMDEHLHGRFCVCGGIQELRGEGSRDEAGRRYRFARLLCLECEEFNIVYFETTDLVQ